MNSEELLERALTGVVPEEDFQAFLTTVNQQRKAGHEGEGLTHDFKSGRLLAAGKSRSEEKEALEEIRRDLLAFANAGGGVVIIGVAEPSKGDGDPKSPVAVDGVQRSAEAIHDYLKSLMNPLLSQIYDYPIATALKLVSGHVVWLLAIQRHAGGLLYLTFDKKTVFPMRIGDNTVDLHHHLVTDLLVGRRATPTFSVEYNVTIRRTSGGGHLPLLQWQCSPRITNTAMTYADDVVVSVIAQHQGGSVDRPLQSGHAPDRNVLTKPLADRIDTSVPCQLTFQRWNSIATFDVVQGRLAPSYVDVNTSRIRAALAVACRNGPLYLYQLDFEVRSGSLNGPDESILDRMAVPCRRPIVDIEAIHRIWAR